MAKKKNHTIKIDNLGHFIVEIVLNEIDHRITYDFYGSFTICNLKVIFKYLNAIYFSFRNRPNNLLFAILFKQIALIAKISYSLLILYFLRAFSIASTDNLPLLIYFFIVV